MLTEREVIGELRRIGVKDTFLLKKYLGEFEEYMAKNYGVKIIKEERESELGLARQA